LRRRQALTLNVRISVRRMLARRYLRGEGLEIGALHLPLPLPASARATYIDRLSTSELRRELPELADKAIVDVGVIDDGERLRSVADGTQEFVIANHMIEHCEDPVGTIRHHLRVLRPGGRLFMAVPEKRRTFDRDREVTPFEHVLRDYQKGREWSRAEHYREWAQFFEGAPPERLDERARYMEEHGWCIHFHVWTRQAFRALLAECRDTLGFPLEVDVVWPNLAEFVVVCRRTSGELPAAPR